jgi:hypothetical protein
MKSFKEYLNEVSSEIASRLSGAYKKHGKLEKSEKAQRGAEKRQEKELQQRDSDFFRPDPKEKEKSDERMKRQFDLGLKSGRVTSKNLRNPSWPDMKDRPDRILTAKHGTAY